mgnify:FL=1
MREVWAVKYRPNDLTEFVGQDSMRDEFQQIIEGKAKPQHYIFYSPEPGTGKTSLAHILAKKLGYVIHQYNASSKHQRGIEFVEQDLAPKTRLGQYETFFFLDEADQLTPAAQSALKGVIEGAQGYFILTCNDLSKVSRWLQSRCQVRVFQPLDTEDVLVRLRAIANAENVSIADSGLALIAKAHEGDLRNSINALQAYHTMPEGSKNNFLLGLDKPDLDAKRFLTLCLREQQVEDAVKMIHPNPNLRRMIDVIFEYGINSPAKADNKLKLVEAATQAQRDLIDGVEDHYVAWDFCRRLAKA